MEHCPPRWGLRGSGSGPLELTDLQGVEHESPGKRATDEEVRR